MKFSLWEQNYFSNSMSEGTCSLERTKLKQRNEWKECVYKRFLGNQQKIKFPTFYYYKDGRLELERLVLLVCCYDS